MRVAAFLIALALTLGISVLMPRLSQPPDRFTVGLNLIEEGRADEAASLFQEPVWKGIAEYRAGRFRRALLEFSANEDVMSLYNMGNTHARLHDWTNAKAAYRKVLHLDPSHADALFNLDLIEQAEELEKQQLADSAGQNEDGGWRDTVEGTEEALAEPEDGLRTEEDTRQDATSDDATLTTAQEANDTGGQSDAPGLAGKEALSDDAGRGISADPADAEAEAELPAQTNTAVIRREGDQAAEILLRQIQDDPERVLSARLRAAYRLRRELEGSCSDC